MWPVQNDETWSSSQNQSQHRLLHFGLVRQPVLSTLPPVRLSNFMDCQRRWYTNGSLQCSVFGTGLQTTCWSLTAGHGVIPIMVFIELRVRFQVNKWKYMPLGFVERVGEGTYGIVYGCTLDI